LAVLPVLEDGSPPLAVLNTFEAAKMEAHLWQYLCIDGSPPKEKRQI
jgi:hypothetical protein